MKISLFPKQAALNSGPVIAAFVNGCRLQGWEIVEDSLDADAAVIWSVLWAGRMRQNQMVYNHYRSQNKPVFVIEVGNLRRGVTWRVSLNNVNRDGIFGEGDLDQLRPAKLGVSLAPYAPGSDILIACQRWDSLQWQRQSSNWLEHTVKKIKENTDRSIVIRPHPRYPVNIKMEGVTVERPIQVPGTYDEFDLDYKKFHCVVNHNSGPSVQAAIHGVNTICDPSSLAWPVSIDYSEIEYPPIKDRAEWFLNLCHTEYLVEEISQGLPLKRLQKVLFS